MQEVRFFLLSFVLLTEKNKSEDSKIYHIIYLTFLPEWIFAGSISAKIQGRKASHVYTDELTRRCIFY